MGVAGGSDENNVGNMDMDSSSFADPVFVRVYVRNHQFRDPIDLFQHMFGNDVDQSTYFAFEDNPVMYQQQKQMSCNSGSNFYSTKTTTHILNGKVNTRTEKMYPDGSREIIVNGRTLQEGEADIENSNSEFSEQNAVSICGFCGVACCVFCCQCCQAFISCFTHLVHSCIHKE